METKQLKEILIQHKENHSAGVVLYHTVKDKEFISYAELYHMSLRYLGYLQEIGIKKGQEVIVDFCSYKHYLCAFWACILGDYICMPLKLDVNHPSMLADIIHCCHHPVLITEQEFDEVTKSEPELIVLREEAFYQQEREGVIDLSYVSDVIFVQFSSGSTSAPKGVMITNQNIFTSLYDTQTIRQLKNSDVFLTWTPMTHNLSLIVFHLYPMLTGSRQIILSTKEFLTNPRSWFQVCTEEKITCSVMTNFGIMKLVQAIQGENKSENYDLSNMKHLLTGSDMISPEHSNILIEKIVEYHGYPNIFSPGYGLSEATLAVSCTEVGDYCSLKIDPSSFQIGQQVRLAKAGKISRSIVCVGALLEHVQGKICDLEDHEAGDFVLGIIKVKGPSVMRGYYENPEMTKEIIDQDGWLNTGDIGFFKDHQLYVTGRYKELILYNGKNYFSYDIEQFITDGHLITQPFVIEGIRIDHSMNDRILCFVEGSSNPLNQSVINQIREAVVDNFHVVIDDVIFLEQIPRTGNNKINRYELRSRYQSGEWLKNEQVAARHYQEKEIEDYVTLIFSDVSGKMVFPQDRISEMGFTSLEVTNIYEKLSQKFSNVSIADLFEVKYVSDLIDHISLS